MSYKCNILFICSLINYFLNLDIAYNVVKIINVQVSFCRHTFFIYLRNMPEKDIGGSNGDYVQL